MKSTIPSLFKHFIIKAIYLYDLICDVKMKNNGFGGFDPALMRTSKAIAHVFSHYATEAAGNWAEMTHMFFLCLCVNGHVKPFLNHFSI